MNRPIPTTPSRKQRPVHPPNARLGLDRLAIAIDDACDAGDTQELRRLAVECENAMGTAPSESRVLLLYYRSNALAGIASVNHRHADHAWSWTQTERVQSVLLLRCALKEPAFKVLDAVRRYQILTNLANYLNNFGRPIAANEQWLRVLDDAPTFAMALANRANALCSYASHVYDNGHSLLLLWAARKLLDQALSETATLDSHDPSELAPGWITKRRQIQDHLARSGFDEDFDTNQWALGRSPEERTFRSWCLQNRLFLNPLNDTYLTTVSASDVLHLPSHSYPVTEAPRFPSYFNLLKQEYVSARYRLFRAMHEPDTEPDFVMRDVLMLPGGYDQVLGHHTEDLRSAFRSAYAIFDKIGLFLNDYYGVGLKPRDVTFRSIWSQRRGATFSLREPFRDKRNWLLRGLYFLSKDLFDPLFKDTAAPDAEDLAALRNAAEHRFLSLQPHRQDRDTSTHSFVSVEEFERKTLRLLKMAREALIYLSLAMHQEERARSAKPSE